MAAMASAPGLHRALGSIWLWDVDDVIKKLLSVRNVKTSEKFILKESEVAGLCQSARNIFLQQPMLLELEAPVKILGDVHGQYEDLLQFFDIGGFPPESNYLFMGDYVDKGRLSLECICLLLAYKVKYPENFFLLRGNHESSNINKEYGFYDECKRRHSVKIWKTFNSCFDCMPVAAVVEEKIFCCHGGISQDLHSFDQIRRLHRPTEIPTSGVLCDLLWADPDPYIKKGYARSDRGVSYLFSAEELMKFLNTFKLDLVCRGHQVVEDGYEFFAKRKLVTVFSAKNYCGEFDNPGAMMSVDKDLMCSFTVLKPEPKKKIARNTPLASPAPDFRIRNGRL